MEISTKSLETVRTVMMDFALATNIFLEPYDIVRSCVRETTSNSCDL